MLRNERPLVSVIIPTYNSQKSLELCLESLKCQTYQNIEVIIVDAFSADGTAKIAEKYGAKTVFFKARRSEARNKGSSFAKASFLLSLDSDMQLTKNVVNDCVIIAEHGFDAIIIPELSTGEGFWAQCKALEKICYLNDDSIEASRFFKKSFFDMIGGYDPLLEAGEDWDIHRRIIDSGGRVGRSNSPIKHYEGNLKLGTTIRKKYFYGKSLEKYKAKNPIDAKKQLSIMRPALLRNWRKLSNDPIHTIGLLTMKACEYAALSIGTLYHNRTPNNEVL